ncbi:hypothetical protein BC830DRAFT_481945 [Chytriomyces sp. MP71]|nr:hypothetical protein BC830DRAFT_481945 [Chytriomyces sp. MP71]
MANPDSEATLEAKLQQIKDFTSASAFVPLTGPQPDHNYFLLLSKIFGRILEFAKANKTATSNPRQNPQTASDFSNQQLDLQVQFLETSLKSWFAFLPPHLSDQSITQSANGQLRDDALTYEKQHLHLFYHICYILLHRPKLMHMLRVLPPSTHHASIPRQDCYIKCLAHAGEITALLERVRARNPHMRFFPPFITCFGVFQSALVHLVRGQVTCTRVAAAPRDDEPGCRAALVHAEALKGLSRDWGLAVKLHVSLVGLIEAAKEGATSVSGRMCEACVGVGARSPPVAGQQLGQGHEDDVIELHRRDAQFLSHPSGGGRSSSAAAAEGAFGGLGGLGGVGSWLAGVPAMPHLQSFPGGPGDGAVGANGVQGAAAGNVEDMWHLLGAPSFGDLNSSPESFGFH